MEQRLRPLYLMTERKPRIIRRKIFKNKVDGKHFFTSFESYDQPDAYKYKPVDEPVASKLAPIVVTGF